MLDGKKGSIVRVKIVFPQSSLVLTVPFTLHNKCGKREGWSEGFQCYVFIHVKNFVMQDWMKGTI